MLGAGKLAPYVGFTEEEVKTLCEQYDVDFSEVRHWYDGYTLGRYPALVVELKWKKRAQTAIQQIKEKKYPESLLQHTGDILLVGINCDKDSKKHECMIEKYEKN